MNDLLTAEDFVEVGYIGGLYGYEGQLRVDLNDRVLDGLNQTVRFLYFIQNGMYVPRFIASYEPDHSLIGFERYSTRELARELTDQIVYLRKTDLPKSFGTPTDSDRLDESQLMGYRIWDASSDSLIGTIENVEEYPGGWMALTRLEHRPDSVMIPLAIPLIHKIDSRVKTIYMELPEGLLDL